MRKIFNIFAAAVLAVALLAGVSEAGVISIANASFEDPDAGTGATSFTGDDWQVDGTAGVVYETDPAAPDGDQWAYIKEATTLYQDIGTVSADTTYTVKFWVGARATISVSRMDVALYAGGTGPSDWTQLGRVDVVDQPSPGNKKFYSLDVATTTDLYTDQTLWLGFVTEADGGSKQNAIDDVSVIPEPATFGLLALFGVLGLLRRKLRR